MSFLALTVPSRRFPAPARAPGACRSSWSVIRRAPPQAFDERARRR